MGRLASSSSSSRARPPPSVVAPGRRRATTTTTTTTNAAAAAAAADEGSATSTSFASLASSSSLHADVARALSALGFDDATTTQAAAIPSIAANDDVVLAAETGSGKTFAYLAPIISNLTARNAVGVGRVGALILCPNATLCAQVAAAADSLRRADGATPLVRTVALTPNAMLDDRNLPDVVVATPARAAADVLRFNDGGWRRGNFHPAVVHIRHVVFDEADALLSGGYLRAVRGCFDVLYREEKLAALGLTAPPASDDDADVASADSSDLGDVAADRDSADVTADPGWTGDAKRNDAAYEKDWRDDHDDVGGGGGGRDRDRRPRGYHRGPALGGKGLVGSGAGRDFRRQYVFAAATVMSNGKKTPGAIIRHGFPDARWVQGKRLHMAVERCVLLTLVPVRPRRRGERRSLRTFPGVHIRPPLGFNARLRRLSTPTYAFELHPDVRLEMERPSESRRSGSRWTIARARTRSGRRSASPWRKVRTHLLLTWTKLTPTCRDAIGRWCS